MTGEELHQLLLQKWGRSYDIQLRNTQGKLFVLIMWKYQEQASFPLSRVDYLAHLERVANYLNEWGGAPQLKGYLENTRERPRLGKAISIPLDVRGLGDRASEWML